MQTYKKTAVYRGESRLFYSAVLFLMLSAAAYAYFLCTSVVNVVMRKDVDVQISAVSTTMSELESDYIELQSALSADTATQKGFVVATKRVFIDKSQSTLVLSHN